MTTSPMLTRVLKAAIQRGASDVHAKAGDVFRARVDGKLVPLTKQRLTPAQTARAGGNVRRHGLDDPRLATLRDFDCSWGDRRRRALPRQRLAAAIVVHGDACGWFRSRSPRRKSSAFPRYSPRLPRRPTAWC